MSNTTAPPPPPAPDCSETLCYNIITTSQFTTSLWLSVIGGILCLITFAYVRGSPTWRPIYHKRATQISDLILRPRPLRLSGFSRIWSYFEPIFLTSDGDLLGSCGMDVLVLVRFTQLGIQIFFPLTVIGLPSMLPSYYYANALKTTASNANADGMMLYTLSNVRQGSKLLWLPWSLSLVFMLYIFWVLGLHYCSYATLCTLRHHSHPSTRWRRKGPASGILRKGSLRKEGWSNFLSLISPWHMYKCDVAFVLECLEEVKKASHTAAVEKIPEEEFGLPAPEVYESAKEEVMETERMNLLNTSTTLVCSDGVQGGGGDVSVSEKDAAATVLAKHDVPAKHAVPGTWAQWGDQVTAPIPEGVCTWWKLPEETPAKVNAALAGGGVLLGKTSAHRRSRIPATMNGSHVWQNAKLYTVLFRSMGPIVAHRAWSRLGQPPNRKKDLGSIVGETTEMQAAMADGRIAAELQNAQEGPATEAEGTTTQKGTAAEVTVVELNDNMSPLRIDSFLNIDSIREMEVAAACPRGEVLEHALRKLFPATFQELVPVWDHRAVDKAVEHWDHVAGALERVETALTKITKKDDNAAADFIPSNSTSLNSAKVQEGVVVDEESGLGGVDEKKKKSSKSSTSKKPTATDKTAKKVAKKAEKAARELESLLKQRTKLTEDLIVAEEEVIAQRKRALENPTDTAYFALFTSQRDALAALRGDIGAVGNINMSAQHAPGADEINWEALWSTYYQRAWRTLLAIPILILVLVFPIGPMTGALTNLDLAVCGGSADTNNIYWPWFCEGNVNFARAIITGILPVAISTFFDTYFLPLAFYFITQSQKIYTSFSSLDAAVIKCFFAFDALNTFAGTILGGAIFQQMGAILSSDGEDMFTLIGTALPAASNFFLNYVAIHAFFTNVFRFIWPHDGTVLFVFFRMFGMHRPKCPRDEWVIRSTPSYRGGRHHGAFLLTFIIGIAYAVVAPFILPVCLAYFFTAWMTWRYSAIHFYEPCYDGGGHVWELLYTLMLWTLWIAAFFVCCVFIALQAFWSGGALLLISSAAILVFDRFMKHTVVRYTLATPAQLAEWAPKVDRVPREVYMAPPMRVGAVGWFPEWGKVWEKYGLPRYSIW